MTNIFDFIDLIENELSSLIDVIPVSVSSVFLGAATFSIILCMKRAILS